MGRTATNILLTPAGIGEFLMGVKGAQADTDHKVLRNSPFARNAPDSLAVALPAFGYAVCTTKA